MFQTATHRTSTFIAGVLLVPTIVIGCRAGDRAVRTSDRSPRVETSGPLIPRFDVADVMVHADDSFDSRTGSPNPFEVAFAATVTSPSGQERLVNGFFDGDGTGGPVGNVFRLRIQPDEEGTWTWVTRSQLPELDGLEGDFECRGALRGMFGRGGIVVSDDQPRFFGQSDGPPIFLLGKFLDVDAPESIRYSHTFLSEDVSDEDRQRMLDRHAGMGLNKMNIYIANRGDYGGLQPTTPWLGSAMSRDERRFALDRWHGFEHWIERLREADVAAQLWLFADDSDFGSLGRSEKESLVSYAMARLSPYVNTLFVLMLEWQEDWSREEVASLGRFTQANNPWGRLVSAHGKSGDFEFADSEWADFVDLQAGDVPYQRVYETGLRNWSAASTPLVQEEFAIGGQTDENRRRTWAALMSGAAALGTGAYLSQLEGFVSSIPFYSLSPARALLISGEGFVLAHPDSQYVAYLPHGGAVELDLSGAGGRYVVRWYDPSAGSWAEEYDDTIAAGQPVRFQAPDKRDWTLLLTRTTLDPELREAKR